MANKKLASLASIFVNAGYFSFVAENEILITIQKNEWFS